MPLVVRLQETIQEPEVDAVLQRFHFPLLCVQRLKAIGEALRAEVFETQPPLPEKVLLLQVANGVVADTKQLLKNGQEIKLTEHGTPETIISDVRLLKNVFFNLISNAIKYSDLSIDWVIRYSDDQCTAQPLLINGPQSREEHCW